MTWLASSARPYCVEYDIVRERERLYSDGSALSAGGDAAAGEGVPRRGEGRNVNPPWLSQEDPQNIGGAPFVGFDGEGNDGTHAWSNKGTLRVGQPAERGGRGGGGGGGGGGGVGADSGGNGGSNEGPEGRVGGEGASAVSSGRGTGFSARDGSGGGGGGGGNSDGGGGGSSEGDGRGGNGGGGGGAREGQGAGRDPGASRGSGPSPGRGTGFSHARERGRPAHGVPNGVHSGKDDGSGPKDMYAKEL
jgi:hypothetical protein